jgi:hypothetical protein
LSSYILWKEQLMLVQEPELDEQTRRMRDRFDRVVARTDAGPAEILLVPVGQEPSSPHADSFDLAFAVCEQVPKRFIWLEQDISTSAEVIAAAIYAISLPEPLDGFQPACPGQLEGYIYKVRLKKTDEEFYLPVFGSIGCFWLRHSDSKLFFLYIQDAQLVEAFKDPDLPSRRPTTLYQRFQEIYAAITQIDILNEEAEPFARLFGFRYDKHKPKRFSSLVRRSLNRRRNVNSKTRVRILDRDNRTCQICGRKPPSVKLVVDHRIPVEKGGSNDDSNLWTLCEDCNRGKSNLLLFR